MSYTNPNPGDPVLQQLVNGNYPQGALVEKTLLTDGATGTNIATGQTNQPIPLSDPDSLKTTPNGGLILTSGADNSFAIISGVGTAAQSVRFDQLTNLPAGSALDDVIIPTSSSGTFYVSNAGTDQIEAFKVSGLNTSDAYASVGTEIVQVDLQTGAQTVLIAGLSGSHGLAFAPSAVSGPVVQSQSIFALGSEAKNATAPDSITRGDGSYFVEYGNGADSTGRKGSSTIVQYSPIGKILHSYTLPGEVDGLKFNPNTGKLWALDNQDGNSKLYLIDPITHQVSKPLTYAPPYVYGANSTRGFDDVAFDGGKVFLSYTNPANIGDPVVVELNNGNNPIGPLTLTSILRFGDTGTNLTTGQVNQPIPITDPDSLKTLPDGSLILTGGADSSLVFISHPGTAQQSVSFVNLPAGASGPDDAIVPTSRSGTFYISNTGANDVIKATVTGLNPNDVYVAVGGDNAVEQLDPHTGVLTPVITGLNDPHGLQFVPGTTSPSAPSLSSAIGSLGNALLKDILGNQPFSGQALAGFGRDIAAEQSPVFGGYIDNLAAIQHQIQPQLAFLGHH